MRINYDDEEPSPIPNQLPKGTDNIPSGLKVLAGKLETNSVTVTTLFIISDLIETL